MTDKIKGKFEKRDELNSAKRFKEAIKMGKEIKKDIRKARNEKRMEELKEKLWFDIKNIKKGFQANNTKIRDKNDKPVPSNRKAETLAEHFKNKQWGDNRKKGETANQLLFDTIAEVDIDNFTMKEFENARKKLQMEKLQGRMVSRENFSNG